jgi:hypothetical protein
MYLRRSVARLPWQQLSRRPFAACSPRLRPSPAPADASPPSAEPAKEPSLAAALQAPHKMPQAASSLSSLPAVLLQKTGLLPDPEIGSVQHAPAPRGAPVPAGHNEQIYRIVATAANAGQDPAVTELNDLFRMMLHDSPFGEMKDEAMAVWRTMRDRGIHPTKEGFRALFAVGSFTSLTFEQLVLMLCG